MSKNNTIVELARDSFADTGIEDDYLEVLPSHRLYLERQVVNALEELFGEAPRQVHIYYGHAFGATANRWAHRLDYHAVGVVALFHSRSVERFEFEPKRKKRLRKAGFSGYSALTPVGAHQFVQLTQYAEDKELAL